MSPRTLSLHLAALALVALAATALGASPAYGSSVTLAVTSTNVSGVEGVSSPTADFTLTNNSGVPIAVWSAGLPSAWSSTFLSGDVTDQFTPHIATGFNPGTCGLGVALADGASCTLSQMLTQLLDAPGTTEDTDFGLSSITFYLDYVSFLPSTGGWSTTPSMVTAQFDATMYDAPVPAPEPPTLGLLGLGLAGLAGLARRHGRLGGLGPGELEPVRPPRSLGLN